MKNTGQAVTLVTLGLAAFAVDRGLKALALSGVTLGPVDGGLRFELFPNPAIAFSIYVPASVSTALIPAVVVIFIWLGWRWRQRGDLTRAAVTAVIVAAAFSNYLDRLRHGYVVDYVSLGNWFPVFNLSDVVIVAGLVLLGVAGRKKERSEI